jgi:hypothetical protein
MPSSTVSRLAVAPNQPLIQWVPGSVTHESSAQRVQLITYLHQVQSLINWIDLYEAMNDEWKKTWKQMDETYFKSVKHSGNYMHNLLKVTAFCP